MNNDGRGAISEGRQLLYYAGMALMAVGLLLFFSVFVSAASGPSKPRPVVWVSPGSEDNYSQICGVLGMPCDAEVRVGSPGSSPAPYAPSKPRTDDLAGRAMAGFAMAFVGGILMNLGRAGMRGSGVVLDPHGARDDLKPWNQARGAMLDDTLGSSEIVGRLLDKDDDKPREIVRVRCRECRALNDEDAKFCDNCGASI